MHLSIYVTIILYIYIYVYIIIYLFIDLSPATDYEFRLKGTHPVAGEGAYSSIESFTTSTGKMEG